LLPNDKMVHLIGELGKNEAFLCGDQLLAVRLDDKQFEKLMNDELIDELNGSDLKGESYVNQIKNLTDLFQQNGKEIESDYSLITEGRKSEQLGSHIQVIGDPQKIFIEKGAKVNASTINTTQGPVYIGKDSEVMEGSMIRGPFSLGDYGVIKMGSSFGPYCKVGGEVNNSILFGYSNKAHDGFLGNSVIGEWCNIGADTNTSNLKNNYAEVKLWNYDAESFLPTGTQFCGLIMGDHSKVGINVMFNTGTVVGVNTNIFGTGFPRNFIPSYSLGGASSYKTFSLESAYEVANVVMKRRGKELSEEGKQVFKYIYEQSAKYRRWEH